MEIVDYQKRSSEFLELLLWNIAPGIPMILGDTVAEEVEDDESHLVEQDLQKTASHQHWYINILQIPRSDLEIFLRYCSNTIKQPMIQQGCPVALTAAQKLLLQGCRLVVRQGCRGDCVGCGSLLTRIGVPRQTEYYRSESKTLGCKKLWSVVSW